MKLRLMAAVVLLVPSISQARLIDLTPGGFTDPSQYPYPNHLLSRQTFFDEAVHDFPGVPDGWVSQFGRINGGEFFFTNLFELGNTTSASVSWNFNQQPDNFWLTMVSVFGIEDGETWTHLYLVPFRNRFLDLGSIVTVNGSAEIMGISFYGRNLIPDTGSTLLLGILGLALLFTAHRRIFPNASSR